MAADLKIYAVNGGAGTIGTVQSFIGKTPKFFGVVVKNGGNTAQDLSAETGVDGAIIGILKALEANTSVLCYQVENASSGVMSVMLETANHLAYGDVQAIIRAGGANGVYNGINATGTVVTDTGFKLAAS
jgi:hypothetical protein